MMALFAALTQPRGLVARPARCRYILSCVRVPLHPALLSRDGQECTGRRRLGARGEVRRLGQACLQALMERFGCPAISLSEPFEDGISLLRVAEQRGLEGVVSKRAMRPIAPGSAGIG